MVTNTAALRPTRSLVAVYVVLAAATLVTLAVLSAAGSRLATSDAWVHAVVVAAFAVLLPLRLRAAGRGSRRALVAVGVIAAVLVAVNVVEASLPGLFPAWMRVEMVLLALLMVAVAASVVRAVRGARSGR